MSIAGKGTVPRRYAEAVSEAGIERTADADGPVYFREWDGPEGLTFVCIHGLGGSHVNWRRVAPGLAERGRVLTVDLAGFGRTPLGGRGSDLASNRRLISAFLREATSGPVVLVGNSMGGSLSILQAAVEPWSVAGLILSSPAVPWARGGRPAAIVAGSFALYRIPGIGERFGRWRIQALTPERIVEMGFHLTTADPASVDEGTWAAHVEMARERQADPDAVPAFLEAARSLLSLGSRRKLARDLMRRVSCPVLHLHGGRDRFVPLAFAKAASLQPNWELRVFDDLGHALQIEAPDLWLDAVGEWLDRAPLAERAARTGNPGA